MQFIMQHYRGILNLERSCTFNADNIFIGSQQIQFLELKATNLNILFYVPFTLGKRLPLGKELFIGLPNFNFELLDIAYHHENKSV